MGIFRKIRRGAGKLAAALAGVKLKRKAKTKPKVVSTRKRKAVKLTEKKKAAPLQQATLKTAHRKRKKKVAKRLKVTKGVTRVNKFKKSAKSTKPQGAGALAGSVPLVVTPEKTGVSWIVWVIIAVVGFVVILIIRKR